jgi:hypothetical protein
MFVAEFVKKMRRSDLSGQEGEAREFGRLVVKGHPAVDGPRVLDVLPDEVANLKTVDDLIELEYTAPGGGSATTYVVKRSDFDELAPTWPRSSRGLPNDLAAAAAAVRRSPRGYDPKRPVIRRALNLKSTHYTSTLLLTSEPSHAI